MLRFVVSWPRETKFCLLLPLLAAASFAGGFADLIRGGITLAPILLLLAYVAFVPGAIVLWGRTSDSNARAASIEPTRPPYLVAGVVTAIVFVLYLVTLAPSTAMWDTSEYIAAAYTMGLPHPPGNPLFVIVGRVFSILPIASTVAVRINILAAICSAVSAGMWFLVTERVLVGWLPARWQRILAGSL